ncbi:unnamed protein product [Scytosiphon promiscuus]
MCGICPPSIDPRQVKVRGLFLMLDGPADAAQFRPVMCFNAEGNWMQASEPLHKDIDLRKKDRCGAGPALVCARAVLNLRKASSSSSRCKVIGVVPCAIGGASLDEWQKSFQGVVGDCEGPDGRAKHGHESTPWGYKPGSNNLFGAMAARIQDALEAAPEGSRMSGVLWYQGETDAMEKDCALTYHGRFQTLVKDVRALGYPDLPFFTVAITGTTIRLPYLDKVRDAQLHAGSAGWSSRVWVVDAFGLPMSTDGLHLLTNAQVEVGERMALQVVAATEPISSIRKGSQATSDDWTGSWARQDARIRKAQVYFDRIAALTKSKRENPSDSTLQVTEDVERRTKSFANRTGERGSVPSPKKVNTAGVATATEGGHHSKRDPIKTESRKVQFRSFAKLLGFLEPPPAPQDCLLVLGHGVVSCLIAGALLYNMHSIQGVDLMQGSNNEARELLSVFSHDSSPAVKGTDGLARLPRKLPSQEDVGSAKTPSSSITLVEGDASQARWSNSTLVYAACCHFDDGIMLDIARRCRQLPDCARVITLGKPLPTVHSRPVKEGSAAEWEFRVAWQSQVAELRGGSTVAFVHHRVSRSA